MKKYKVVTLDENGKPLIFINDLDDIYYIYDDIYNDFYEKLGEKFSIIADLFLRNGFSFNRFFLLSFNGIRNVKVITINPGEISEESKSEIREYLKSNLELLEESCLTKSVKDFVINH